MGFLIGGNTLIVLGNNLHQTFQRWLLGVLLVGCLSASASAGELINVSTRGFVGTGDNVLIGGFIIEGSPQTVLVRVPGPSLTALGVSGALANPSVELFSGQTSIAFNDDWQTAANASSIPATLKPKDSREPAILITLNPGPYTAIVRGVGGTTGVALVEVFKIFASASSGEFSGRWSIFASKTSDTCGLPAGFLNDTLVVDQNDSQLTASVSDGALRFAGTVNITTGEFALTQTNPIQSTVGSCTVEVQYSFTGNFRSGTINSTLSRRKVSGSCPSGANCDVVFVGTMTKQASLEALLLEDEGLSLEETINLLEGISLKDALNLLLE